MAEVPQLPGATGQTPEIRMESRARRVFGVLAVILVAIAAAVLGLPGGAGANPKSSAIAMAVPAVAIHIGLGPSPHPAPGTVTSAGGPPVTMAAVPAPSPQSPPQQRTAEQDVAFVGPDGTSPIAAPAPRVAGPPPRATAHAIQPKHVNAISADRLDHSLIYSSGLALAIAAGGLLLIGSRRRLW
jgi:hypothetical protein